MPYEFDILHLYLSPRHNYFGHHGKEAGESPLIEVPEIECVARQGIRGDRFFGFKPGYKGQITFFALETYTDLCRQLNAHGRSPGVFRRNVVTRGVDLNSCPPHLVLPRAICVRHAHDFPHLIP